VGGGCASRRILVLGEKSTWTGKQRWMLLGKAEIKSLWATLRDSRRTELVVTIPLKASTSHSGVGRSLQGPLPTESDAWTILASLSGDALGKS